MSVLIGTPLEDTLTGTAGENNTIFGDAVSSLDGKTGGNDLLRGGANGSNTITGDSGGSLINLSTGGNDVLIGGDGGANNFSGDALSNLENASRGGNDTLTGGANSTNTLRGDAGSTLRESVGGDDILVGGANSTNRMFGDAGSTLSRSVGGNDRLVGGANSTNTMFGDAGDFLETESIGGNDTLIAGASGTNILFGDARLFVGSGSKGGDDHLVSDTGKDDMWGDTRSFQGGSSIGGRDVFVFGPDNGNDIIHDFERGKDLIDVGAISTAAGAIRSAGSSNAFAALGPAVLGGLVIEEVDADGDGKIDSVIHLGGENSVTVLGVTGLSDSDFDTSGRSSYVLFSRTSLPDGTRDKWVGSEANSHPSTTPGSTVPASTFDADLATGPGTALEGPGAADYAADGTLQNANLVMFNLTEAPSGTFATDAPADLAARIAAGTPFFGTANTDLDPAQSDIDLAAGRLHLAQTDADRNGIRNLEISLDSATSFRDIRLENFVDTRLKLGDVPAEPQGERFEVQLLGAERGEVDASEAPEPMDLLLAPRTGDGTFRNSFIIKGSVFDDTVTIEAGEVSASVPGQGAGSTDITIVGDNSIPGRTGSNDTLTGGANFSNTIFGDVGGNLMNVGGGNDVLIGGANGINTMAGDAGGDQSLAGGGNDHLTGGTNSENTMFGDARGNAVGGNCGNDVLIGGENSENTMIGDLGGNGTARARLGADTLTGGADSTNLLIGDAQGDLNGSSGGDDVLTGGADSVNMLIGDAQGDLNGSSGGDDVLTGGADSVNMLIGDAQGTLEDSVGGDDILIGGTNSTNELFGDAKASLHGGHGGNDVLVAGAGEANVLVGDAESLDGTGGDDLLISGTGADDMWGDAKQLLAGATGGRDIFGFAADNGDDIIHDFERGKDLIDLSGAVAIAAGIQTVAAQDRLANLVRSVLDTLDIEETDVDKDGESDSVIHFDANNSVTVLGVTGLTQADFAGGGTSYVLFGRTAAPIGTRDKWLGSEGNSQASNTPGSGFRGSAFNADAATAAGTVLAGAGFADYAADGILTNANVAMFDLTEAPLGVFATGAAADLETKIASNTPLFGGAKTDLDPAHSNVDAVAGVLHLAQTDADWNGIKNIEVSLDSTTSLRDIRLEKFVDTRVKIGDASPVPGTPDGAAFDVALLGTKRGEVDASHAPAAIALTLDVWTNNGTFQNSFEIKGSVFDDVVTIGPGVVGAPYPEVGPGGEEPAFTPIPPWYLVTLGQDDAGKLELDLQYKGTFTTVFANLGAGDDHYDTFTDFIFGGFAGQFSVRDVVWGGSGDDRIQSGHGNDRLFGDNGSGAWLNPDPLPIGRLPGNDSLDAGAGADWLEGNTDTGQFEIQPSGGTPRFLHIVTHGDAIDCGRVAGRKGLPSGELPDSERDVVNFNAGDGFDVVRHFGPFAIVPGPFPPEPFRFGANDVLRIENVGTLTAEVLDSSEGMGTLVQNGAGSVFLVGVTTPLAQSTDGKYLLLFDAS